MTLQPALFERHAAVVSSDDKLLALMRRLGIEAFPHHETLLIPIARIVVPGAEALRPPARLMKSIKQVGILQMPAVELVAGTDLHAPDATWRVLFGRRRVLAARLAGFEVIKCEAYEPGTPQLASLLALIENDQRSAAWIKEVQDLHQLIGDKVGLTIDDLAAFGFDRGSLKERLKIAQLPLPLLTAIFAGKLSEALARKIARLVPSQQELLAHRVLSGEELTAELIKSALRRQVNAGLALLQQALAETMVPERPSVDAPAVLPVALAAASAAPSPVPVLHAGQGASAASNLAQVLVTLRSFECQLIPSSVTQPLRLLTKSLIQQLEIAERDATPLLVPHVLSHPQEVPHV